MTGQPILTLEDAAAFLTFGIADNRANRDATAARLLTCHAGQTILIERRASGRPQLRPPLRALGVSLSHRDDALLAGFSPSHDVGVDIEIIDPGLNVLALARDHFSDAEYSVLNRTAGALQAELFFRLWCAKEAVLKATGRGIADGLREPDLATMTGILMADNVPLCCATPVARASVTVSAFEEQRGRRFITALAICH